MSFFINVLGASNFTHKFFFQLNSQSGYVTKTSYDVIKLNIGQKMLRFWQVTSENLKSGKFAITLATSNFHELCINKFDSKSY